jgi:hypothetical protein
MKKGFCHKLIFSFPKLSLLLKLFYTFADRLILDKLFKYNFKNYEKDEIYGPFHERCSHVG